MSTERKRNVNAAGTIGLADRRRSRRRELQDHADVTLFAVGTRDEWQCRTVMLNAGADGIACRAHDFDAARLAVGRVLRVVFRIGDCAEPFDWRARIIAITGGGTPGQCVLGLEFIVDADQPAERKRFIQALASVCEPSE